jgi:heptaprenyl diphosphate synthase
MVLPGKGEAGAADSKMAALAALSLFLSTVEYMIPKPLPFIRLGLANVPLLIALKFPPASFFTLVFVKILGQALISGTIFSYIFLLSLSGTLVSAAAMFLLRRAVPEKYISLTGISITGSFLSNITQITMARFFILGPAAVYIIPPFIAAGVVSGTALGMFCENFTRKSLWYRGERPSEQFFAEVKAAIPPSRPGFNRKPLLDTSAFPPKALFFAGLVMSASILLSGSPLVKTVLFFVFMLAALAAGRAGNLLFTAIFFAVITAFNALIPYGRVIYEIGVFRLTEGALLQGVSKAATVEGLIMLSRVTISPRLRLPGRAGALLSEAFLLLPRLLEQKGRIRAKTFIEDVDRVLLRLSS